jgi:hypothetical protein
MLNLNLYLEDFFIEDLKKSFGKYYQFVLSTGITLRIPHPTREVLLDIYGLTIKGASNIIGGTVMGHKGIDKVLESLSVKPYFTIRYNDWVEVFRPVSDDNGEVAVYDVHDGGMPDGYVWTEVTGENESCVILKGRHVVNRVGYYVTEVEPPMGVEIEVDDMDYVTVGKAKHHCICFLEEIGVEEERYEDLIDNFFYEL